MDHPDQTRAMRNLSPARKSTTAKSASKLAQEQLIHFGIDPASEFGQALQQVAANLYQSAGHIGHLAEITQATLDKLPKSDRVSYFNAKKFLCFQLAKLIDSLQPGLRNTYKTLGFDSRTHLAKGDYPLFANVGTLFSSSPAIVRTATYLYACSEWVDDAFHGKESTHPIYSRLLNPTSIALSNTIVELEAGPYSGEYLAWNFNSGMAAIDGILSNQLKRDDILIVSRNIYGGSHQLLHDYFARENRLNITLEWFDGYSGDEFDKRLLAVRKKYQSQLNSGTSLHIYLESPCNPHGYMLDVSAICSLAHQHGHTVMLDSTLATPILNKPLQRHNPQERPDYVIHSYTKDLAGSGNTTAGVVIGESHKMFIPKGTKHKGISWEQTLFWDVYYIKGAFLDADKAAEVLNGIKTLENRVLSKCINTLIFTRYLDSHPVISVNSHGLDNHPNATLRKKLLYLGLPSPLFSIDFEKANIPRDTFVRFFDALSPGFGHMVSLGQNDTLMLCPALTSHSELSPEALKQADIHPTTIRVAMGGENPRDLISHFREAAKAHLNSNGEDFSSGFMNQQALEELISSTTVDVYKQHLEFQAQMAH
ncbi:trans-sulfuration enzyme family protein [Candidatus Sororendozoicomonas aggregata]|uniref:trans-sulfuration enzyme family protein n=1 Tax=Candidatus Sororendozoicomonas aggregata TaxID=3073239 RepID=UPI002ED1B864